MQTPYVHCWSSLGRCRSNVVTWLIEFVGLGRASSRGRLGSNSGGKQVREREAVPPRLPSGWAAGLDLDRLRGVFRAPEGTTASGWNDAEMRLSDFGTSSLLPTKALQLLLQRLPVGLVVEAFQALFIL